MRNSRGGYFNLGGTGTCRIDNVEWTQIGAVAEYDQNGVSEPYWYDTSGNNNNGIVAGNGATLHNAMRTLHLKDEGEGQPRLIVDGPISSSVGVSEFPLGGLTIGGSPVNPVSSDNLWSVSTNKNKIRIENINNDLLHIGAISFGSYYDMPVSPDLNLGKSVLINSLFDSYILLIANLIHKLIIIFFL